VALSAPATEVVVVTTPRGATVAAATHPDTRSIAIDADVHRGVLSGAAIVDAVHRELRGDLVLCEGGPHLLGSLLQANRVDELFLTVSPRIAGRDDAHPRLGMVAGYAAPPERLPELALASARHAEHHLLLRYRMDR
jgi:riboflavin biosynthesis pyrimidine reductase